MMTQSLRIIQRPCCDFFHVRTVLFLPNYTYKLGNHIEESMYLSMHLLRRGVHSLLYHKHKPYVHSWMHAAFCVVLGLADLLW